MRPTNGKAVNRYYQIDGFTPKGSINATIFVKADNIEQVRNYLATAKTLCNYWVTDCHRYGVLSGDLADALTASFKVSPVHWRYAFACANGGLDISNNRTRLQMRNTDKDLANYLYHNLAPYIEAHRRIAARTA